MLDLRRGVNGSVGSEFFRRRPNAAARRVAGGQLNRPESGSCCKIDEAGRLRAS
jgi:hypothetical protein